MEITWVRKAPGLSELAAVWEYTQQRGQNPARAYCNYVEDWQGSSSAQSHLLVDASL